MNRKVIEEILFGSPVKVLKNQNAKQADIKLIKELTNTCSVAKKHLLN